MPPSWMWPYEDELEIWFAEVERMRNEKYGIAGSDDEESPMMKNELSKGRGK